jgi:hypothetical protein
MTGVRRRASAASVVVTTLAVLAGLAAPAPMSASDDATQILPGHTSLAHAFDVDGDGEREVVRIWSSEPWGPLELEVWSFDRGSWRPTASAPLTGLAAGRGVTLETPIALLEWRDAGRSRLLLVVGERIRPNGGAERFSLLLVAPRGQGLALEPMAADGDGPVEWVQAADLDADGTDELVVTEPVEPRPEVSRRVRLLRWDGERFRSESVTVEDTVVGASIIGETDGHPGADILLASHERAELVRVAVSGSTTVERAELVLDGHTILGAWPAAVAGGTIYLHIESLGAPSMVGVVWPAGGSPAITYRFEEGPFGPRHPIWVGEQLLFLDDPTWRSPIGMAHDVSLLGADGAHLAELPASAAIVRSSRWLEAAQVDGGFLGPYPYAGNLPGGIGGQAAFLVGGHLLVVGDDGRLETQPTSSFVGIAPLGLVGPNDGWMAVTTTFPFVMAPGSVHPAFPVEDAVRIAPAAAVLQPEADDGNLTVSFGGARPVPGPDGGWLASADGGFTVIVEGPVGSQVAAVVGSRVAASETIPASGRTELQLDPRPRRNDTVEYTAAVVRLSPTGHVHATEWRGRVLREPPALEATAETRPGAFEAVLQGRADPHAVVTVDGAAVEVGADGAFGVSVEAGLAPRDVVVRAVDPAGNESAAHLQVVGLVDHRGWPWVPIVGIATALLGAGMYVRAGRRRPVLAIDHGEGTIEEIDVR